MSLRTIPAKVEALSQRYARKDRTFLLSQCQLKEAPAPPQAEMLVPRSVLDSRWMSYGPIPKRGQLLRNSWGLRPRHLSAG